MYNLLPVTTPTQTHQQRGKHMFMFIKLWLNSLLIQLFNKSKGFNDELI